MKIIVGHTNMDLDCIGSMVLARYLFPDHLPVRSHLVHPVARNLYNLYEKRLGFLQARELAGQSVEHMVVVDTRCRQRIAEYLEQLPAGEIQTVVFDHHQEDTSDIPGAVIRERAVGANTTLLGLELLHRNIAIAPEDATIALTGIYADTGNFTHENLQYADFQVAAFCLQSGAAVGLVRSFLKALKEDHQLSLFHDLLNHLSMRDFSGQQVLLGYLEMDRRSAGLAAVAETVFEVEDPDALFAVFSFQKEQHVLIVARSRSRELEVHRILEAFGGSGHATAASALLKQLDGRQVYRALEKHLASRVRPALTAAALMTRQPFTLSEEQSLLEASRQLEKIDHTGAPVTDSAGRLVGFMTLRDIMKGRRGQQMHAPVKAYMTRKVICAAPATPVREIEQLMFTHSIGHLPIVEEGRVVGILTRSDYLRHMERSRREDQDFLEALRERVPPQNRVLLQRDPAPFDGKRPDGS
jgi:tRNA nucleotidyltransferase (CCA-adding enzyme)